MIYYNTILHLSITLDDASTNCDTMFNNVAIVVLMRLVLLGLVRLCFVVGPYLFNDVI